MPPSEMFLKILGAFFALDLLAVLGLVGLVWLVHRRQPGADKQKMPLGCMFGALLFVGICLAAVYWGVARVYRSSS